MEDREWEKYSFWEDNWEGFDALKCRFSRFFSLDANKDVSLSDCGVWENNVWDWRLNWRRGIFVWEETQVWQLLEVVLGSNPASESEDIWVWKESESGVFLVKSAYGILRGKVEGGNSRL